MESPPTLEAMDKAMVVLLENMGIRTRPLTTVGTPLGNIGSEVQDPSLQHAMELEIAQAIDTALKMFTKFAHESAADLRSRKNRATFIHHLPTEILTVILLKDAGGHGHLKRLMPLRLVCRHWARLTLDCPLFWSVLDSRNPPLANVTSLSRGGNTPLDVWFWGADYFYEPFMSLVVPHLERIQSVHYRGERPLLVQSLVIHAKEIEILMDRMESPDVIFELPNASALRSLSMNYLRLDWGSITFGKLTELTLTKIHLWPPTPLELVKIITSSPTPQKLSLGSIFDPSEGSEQGSESESRHSVELAESGPQRVSLPLLTDIYLWDLSETLTKYVLRCTRPAEECTYRIVDLDMKIALETMRNTISERCLSSGPISISVTFYTMWTMDPNRMKYSIKTGNQLSIELHPRNWEATFKALSNCFDTFCDTSPLILTISKDLFEPNRTRTDLVEDPLRVPLPLPYLEGWRNLQEIRILERVDPRPILGVLGQKIQEDAKVQTQPCPVLKCLFIQDWEPEYLSNFDSFLRRRWGTPGMPDKFTVRPKILEGWDARWSSTTFEDLKKTVHEACLVETPEEGIEGEQIVDLTALFGTRV